jgi:hypothetical protein
MVDVISHSLIILAGVGFDRVAQKSSRKHDHERRNENHQCRHDRVKAVFRRADALNQVLIEPNLNRKI